MTTARRLSAINPGTTLPPFASWRIRRFFIITAHAAMARRADPVYTSFQPASRFANTPVMSRPCRRGRVDAKFTSRLSQSPDSEISELSKERTRKNRVMIKAPIFQIFVGDGDWSRAGVYGGYGCQGRGGCAESAARQRELTSRGWAAKTTPGLARALVPPAFPPEDDLIVPGLVGSEFS